MQIFKKIIIFLVIIIILVGMAIWGMRVNLSSPDIQANELTLGSIESFTLESPNQVIKKDGWLMYIKGARAVLVGKDIESAEVRAMPTGTGVGEEYPDGVLLGQMEKSASGTDTWVFTLPPDILATNVWAVATDTVGRVLRSVDLGNVGYDADLQKAVDEGRQPWRLEN